jgi:hypothetical protein
MSVTTMIVVIVAILAFAAMRIAQAHARHGSGPDRALPHQDDGEKRALRSEVEDLRERIKVLERITTDDNTTRALETRRVADEIEALRDR